MIECYEKKSRILPTLPEGVNPQPPVPMYGDVKFARKFFLALGQNCSILFAILS